MTKSTVKIRPLLSSSGFKVIYISGKSGDKLESHKVNENALLLVQGGSVTYQEADKEIVLSEGEGHQIPSEVFHEVRCNDTAAVFLVVPIKAKMKFDRS